MGRSLVVAVLALVGLLCAAGMGYAAYVVSRDSVAVPVTKLQPVPKAADAGSREAARARAERGRSTTTARPRRRTGDDDRRRPRRPRRLEATAATAAAATARTTRAFLELGEGGPARVRLGLAVLVRLVVQVLAADPAEAGAVGLAEDLVRQLERDGVARPRREVELVVVDVDRAQLLVVAGLVRLVLARRDGHVEHGVLEAAEARAVQPRVEAQLEDGPGRGARDRQLGRHRARHRQVALAAELERLELDLLLAAVLRRRSGA